MTKWITLGQIKQHAYTFDEKVLSNFIAATITDPSDLAGMQIIHLDCSDDFIKHSLPRIKTLQNQELTEQQIYDFGQLWALPMTLYFKQKPQESKPELYGIIDLIQPQPEYYLPQQEITYQVTVQELIKINEQLDRDRTSCAGATVEDVNQFYYFDFKLFDYIYRFKRHVEDTETFAQLNRGSLFNRFNPGIYQTNRYTTYHAMKPGRQRYNDLKFQVQDYLETLLDQTLSAMYSLYLQNHLQLKLVDDKQVDVTWTPDTEPDFIEFSKITNQTFNEHDHTYHSHNQHQNPHHEYFTKKYSNEIRAILPESMPLFRFDADFEQTPDHEQQNFEISGKFKFSFWPTTNSLPVNVFHEGLPYQNRPQFQKHELDLSNQPVELNQYPKLQPATNFGLNKLLHEVHQTRMYDYKNTNKHEDTMENYLTQNVHPQVPTLHALEPDNLTYFELSRGYLSKRKIRI